MDTMVEILVVLGLLILTIFHGSHTDDEGVPLVGCENGVHVAEGLVAALLFVVLVKLVGAPGWFALGIVALGLYIQDVRIGLHRSIRKHSRVS